MHFDRPNYKKEKVKGFEEGYKFKHVETIGLSLETNEGGWENLEPAKVDRVLIFTKGWGSAKIQNRTYRFDEGDVIEVPQGVTVEMNGQFKYFCITNKKV
jgi:gentisate 1,2-dioxygenase